MSYSDGVIKPLVITFRQWGDQSPLVLTENFRGDIVFTIGNETRVVPAQDILNAARLMGAKDITTKVK